MRQPKPYHKHMGKGEDKKGRGWYANIGPNKSPVPLASEEEGEKVAWEKYHALMANRQPVNGDCPVADLLDRFLDRKKARWAERTYKFHCDALSSFARFIGALRVSALKPRHVEDWLHGVYPKASNG